MARVRARMRQLDAHHSSPLLTRIVIARAWTQVPGAPNLDVRLTRSQSGSILDIDFVGGASRRAAESVAFFF